MDPEAPRGIVEDREPAISRLAARLRMQEPELVARMRRLVERMRDT